MFICMQKLHKSLLFWGITKILQTCYFGYFWYAWLWSVKTIFPARKKLWCLPSCKKSYSSLTYILKYCKDIENFLFWVLWVFWIYVWPCPPKAIYLQTQNHRDLSIFLQILHFKESCNLIGQEHFGQYIQNKNFARHWSWDGKSRIKKKNYFALFLGKTNDKIFKNTKYPIFRSFCSNLGKNELSTKIGLRPFLASIVLISCKKLEKTNDPVLRKTIN